MLIGDDSLIWYAIGLGVVAMILMFMLLGFLQKVPGIGRIVELALATDEEKAEMDEADRARAEKLDSLGGILALAAFIIPIVLGVMLGNGGRMVVTVQADGSGMESQITHLFEGSDLLFLATPMALLGLGDPPSDAVSSQLAQGGWEDDQALIINEGEGTVFYTWFAYVSEEIRSDPAQAEEVIERLYDSERQVAPGTMMLLSTEEGMVFGCDPGPPEEMETDGDVSYVAWVTERYDGDY